MTLPTRSPWRKCSVLAVLLLAGFSSAQEHISTYLGESAGGALSVSTHLGDVDGDGISDHALGAPQHDGARGRVRVLSGGTGTELWRRAGDLPGDQMGFALAGVPDVDGDGINDVVIGIPATAGGTAPGRVVVRSGLTGELISQIFGSQTDSGFGFSVGGLHDVNGDGRGDVLVGAPFQDGPGGVDAGAVSVFSGRNGSPLAQRNGNLGGDLFGWSMQGAILSGDGNPDPFIGLCSGDGNPDPIIGAPQTGTNSNGYAVELSMLDFSEVRRHLGPAPGSRFGASVSIAGDVDADGTFDRMVGWSPVSVLGLPAGVGGACVLSGATGLTLHVLASGLPDDGFGLALAGLGDVDGDGNGDLGVGAPASDGSGWTGPGAGTVRVFSGATGLLLHVLHGATGANFGAALAYAGDLDGDGLADASFGAPGDGNTGSVFLMSLARWTDLHGGVAGSDGVPLLAGAGETSPAATVELTLSNAPAGTSVLLVAGTALVFDATLGTFTPVEEIVVTGLSTDAEGSLVHELQLPTGLPVDSVLYYQFVVSDPSGPAGVTRSNAMAGHSN